MTPQERAAAPVEVRQALADKVKNLIVSNLTHEENQLWLANVDAFEERAYQRGRRAALLEAVQMIEDDCYGGVDYFSDADTTLSFTDQMKRAHNKNQAKLAEQVRKLAQEGS